MLKNRYFILGLVLSYSGATGFLNIIGLIYMSSLAPIGLVMILIYSIMLYFGIKFIKNSLKK